MSSNFSNVRVKTICVHAQRLKKKDINKNANKCLMKLAYLCDIFHKLNIENSNSANKDVPLN